MSSGLTIRCSRAGRDSRCAASGELDLSSVAELRAAVIGAAGDADLVRLDLSGVVFIDTTGLGALLELHSTLERRGVALEVVAAEGPVRHAVEITGLAHLLV